MSKIHENPHFSLGRGRGQILEKSTFPHHHHRLREIQKRMREGQEAASSTANAVPSIAGVAFQKKPRGMMLSMAQLSALRQ